MPYAVQAPTLGTQAISYPGKPTIAAHSLPIPSAPLSTHLPQLNILDTARVLAMTCFNGSLMLGSLRIVNVVFLLLLLSVVHAGC